MNFSKIYNGRYDISNLREPYMYVMILLCRLYGERDCSQFFDVWFPLAYHVAMWGKNFNWGGVITKHINMNITQAQYPKSGSPHELHMVSFLLDVLCAKNMFPRLSLN